LDFDPQRPLTEDLWRRHPDTRAPRGAAGWHRLAERQDPLAHGKTFTVTTSGSTGRPVTVTRTAVDALYWDAHTLRGHLWHRRSLGGTLAVIRAQGDDKARWPQGARLSRWGNVTGSVFETGPAVVLNAVRADRPPARMAGTPEPGLSDRVCPPTWPNSRDWRGDKASRCRASRASSAWAACLPPETRRACREVWGVAVADTYSAQELGYMALQCPDHEHFHVTRRIGVRGDRRRARRALRGPAIAGVSW
jgi:phenylacetate-CoA ligase